MKEMIGTLSLVFFVALGSATSDLLGAGDPANVTISVELIKSEPVPPEARDVVISPDRTRLAYVMPGVEGDILVVDGIQTEFRSGRVRDIRFSADSKSYVSNVTRGGQGSVFMNGTEGPASGHTNVAGSEAFHFMSREDMRAVYMSEDRGLVLGTTPQDVPKSLLQLVASDDGQRYAYTYTARNETAKKNEMFLVYANQTHGPYAQINKLQFGPGGHHLACVVLRQIGKQRQNRYFWLDGVEQELGESKRDSVPTVEEISFSPDGRRVGFIVRFPRSREMTRVVIDGKAVGDFYRTERLTFSPDSKRVAFVGNKDPLSPGDQQLWVDGDLEPSYGFMKVNWVMLPQAGNPKSNVPLVFSPDSRELSYITAKEQLLQVVRAGKADPTYRDISSLTYGRDSGTLYYVGRQSTDPYRLVCNQVEAIHSGPHRDSDYRNDSPPLLFLDQRTGKALYVARDIQVLKPELVENFILESRTPREVRFLDGGRHVGYLSDGGVFIDGHPVPMPATAAEGTGGTPSEPGPSAMINAINVLKDSYGNWFDEKSSGEIIFVVRVTTTTTGRPPRGKPAAGQAIQSGRPGKDTALHWLRVRFGNEPRS